MFQCESGFGGFDPIMYSAPLCVSDPKLIVPVPVRILLWLLSYSQFTCAMSPTMFHTPAEPISKVHHQLAGIVSLVVVVYSSFNGLGGSWVSCAHTRALPEKNAAEASGAIRAREYALLIIFIIIREIK